jgi:uncharacterized protein YukE
MPHSYNIKEAKEDWRDTVIEKTNITSDFTIRQFEQNIERLQKTLKELEATHKLNLAMMENIERNHKFVKKLTDEEKNTVAMYWESQQIVKQYAPRIAEFYEALGAEAKEMEAVKTLFGFKDTIDGAE